MRDRGKWLLVLATLLLSASVSPVFAQRAPSSAVQGGAGAAPTYLTRIDECVQPAQSGICTWTIPRKYSGSGFRILLSSPGTTSNALTVPFKIVP